MTSTNYSIGWDSINSGSLDSVTSTNYKIRSSIGEIGIGSVTGSSYNNVVGYRAEQEHSALSVDVQISNDATIGRYVGLNINAKTVTLDGAYSSYYHVGDYIAVIENLGLSERTVVGKIVSLSGGDTVLTVDQFDGATGNIGAVPSGNDDYVMRVDKPSVSFGSILPGYPITSEAIASIQTTYGAGYSLYVDASSTLLGTTRPIADVVDGIVTSSSEEYGASVTGTRAIVPDVDFAVTSTPRLIAQRSSSTGTTYDRIAMTYKLSVTSGTPAGIYSQIVHYTFTPNY